MTSSNHSKISLFSNKSNKDIQSKIYKKFNYKLFEFNQNIRKYSFKYSSKFHLNQIKNMYYNQNINNNCLLTIEHYSKEKNNNKKFLSLKNETPKNKLKQLLLFKNPFPRRNINNYHNYLNLALIPLTIKRRNNKHSQQENCLNKELFKSKLTNCNLDKKHNILLEKNNFSNDTNANNKFDNPEDDYSDCKSLKGIILSLKQRITENRYQLNKTFNEFDKQILQDQYLIERFYEMKKRFPNTIIINDFKKKLKSTNNINHIRKNKNLIYKINNNI